MTFITPLLFSLGLTVGNFIYQVFTTQDWGAACERSYFQTFGIMLFYFVLVRE